MKRVGAVLAFIRILLGMDKPAILLCVFHTIINAGLPIFTVMLSGKLLQQLIDQAPFEEAISTILILVFVQYGVHLLLSYLKCKSQVAIEFLKDELSLSVGKKLMAMPYENLENSRMMDLKQQALVPILEYGTFEYLFEEFLPVMVGSFITMVSTIALIGRGNFILLIPIFLMTAINLLLSAQKGERFKKVMMAVGLVERKIQYFANLANDFMVGKDIRLFGLNKVILKKIRTLNDEEIEHFSNLFYKAAFMDFWETMFTQIQIFSIYAITALQLVHKKIAIGEFFQITGLFINLGTSIYQFFNAFINLRVRGAFIEKYMEFANLSAEEFVEPTCIKEPVQISLNNLYFAYEGSERNILEGINLEIEAGSTIAIVGENGSGKTTLIKLISGLLKPTRGEIRIHEQELKKNQGAFISSVYQDFKLFAFTIRENIVTSYAKQKEQDGEQKKKVEEILEQLDMTEVLENLPKGQETYVYKNFDPNGIELSGGQGQKLAIARAMYKDSGIVLMDEPTAALDAKMEASIFMKMKELAKNKTAIFVSHRLSACLFCDKIVVIEKGKIVEQGSHKELMQIENGRYKLMFLAQAKYYN